MAKGVVYAQHSYNNKDFFSDNIEDFTKISFNFELFGGIITYISNENGQGFYLKSEENLFEKHSENPKIYLKSLIDVGNQNDTIYFYDCPL